MHRLLNAKAMRREKWTNEAARILWYALERGRSGQSCVRVFIDGWNEEWFPEGRTNQAEIVCVGEDGQELKIRWSAAPDLRRAVNRP